MLKALEGLGTALFWLGTALVLDSGGQTNWWMMWVVLLGSALAAYADWGLSETYSFVELRNRSLFYLAFAAALTALATLVSAEPFSMLVYYACWLFFALWLLLAVLRFIGALRAHKPAE